jgi:hypothetical protein
MILSSFRKSDIMLKVQKSEDMHARKSLMAMPSTPFTIEGSVPDTTSRLEKRDLLYFYHCSIEYLGANVNTVNVLVSPLARENGIVSRRELH